MIKTIVVLIVINLCVIQYDTIQVPMVDEKPNLVLLGDSITEISGNENYGSYSDLLTEWWNNRNIEVINSGIGGSMLRDVHVAGRISRFHPKYLVVMYGLNDLASESYGDVNVFKYHYNRVLTETYSQNPNITVFISTEIWVNPYIYNLLGCYSEYLQETFRNATVQIAKNWNITLVDLYPKFYRNSNYSGEDGLHQNELGALKIAETLNKTVYGLLNGSEFLFTDSMKIPHKVNVNLNLNLNLNTNLKDDENNNIFFLIGVFIVFYVACLYYICKKRKNIIEIETKLLQIVHPI